MKRVAILCWLGALLFAGSCLPAQQVSEEHESGEAAAHGEHAEGHGDSGIWWKWANFAILGGALGYLISKKGGAYFVGRSRAIQEGIAEAARLKQDAEARAAEIERRLSNLAMEIEGLHHAASEELAAEEERLRQGTEEAFRKIQTQAEQEIASATKAARQELKAYSAALAIEAARQQIRGRLTPRAEDLLVHSFVADLQRRTSRQPGGEVS